MEKKSKVIFVPSFDWHCHNASERCTTNPDEFKKRNRQTMQGFLILNFFTTMYTTRPGANTAVPTGTS